MTTAGSGGADDFEVLARQYFSAWGDALRHAAQPPVRPDAGREPAAGQGAWQQAIDWWSQLLPADEGRQRDDAVHRFREQAGNWYGTMQQVAAQFAGRDASSGEVASAWREAVEGQGDGLLRWMLDAARGGTRMGGSLPPALARFIEDLQRGAGPWLQVPAFGPGREHQARWQALLKAQQDYQAQSQAYVEQIKAALDDAFGLFEQRLAEHESPGSQLTSARAMFDLWIEVAEEAYAKVAMSEQFQQVYAALGNAQMRLRAAIQHEVERLSESLGLPTRTEMDAAHRKIAELERQVRRLMAKAAPAPAQPAKAPPPTRPARARKTTKAAPAAARKTAADKPGPARKGRDSAPRKTR